VESARFETLRRAIQAWNRGDLEAALADVDPDIEWEMANFFPDATGTFHGHEGVTEFWRLFREPWKEIHFNLERFVEVGEKIVVEGRFRATGRDSGTQVDGVFGQIFTYRDHRLVHFQAFEDFASAAADAGADPDLAQEP
jgi:ketosteroid isomerase-like protein